MEAKINRPRPQCSLTGQSFQPGDAMVSVLLRGGGGLERTDCLATAWAGPPEKCVAWWRSSYPRPEAIGATLAPVDVLLDIIEQLDGNPDETALRYLLSLQLVRRRVLRILDQGSGRGTELKFPAADEPLRLACRRRDCEYLVPIAPPGPETAATVEARLAALLWSGDAA
jgi:hypothetical protein